MDTMGEQFCLKWNNHQTTLISIFDTLLDSGNHVDCCLAAEGKSLNAHKVILSACSPYLEYLLNQHQDKYPVLVFSDLKFHELKAMLEYMYRGEVNVAQEQLNGFLKAAEALQIKGLTDQGGGGSGGGTSSGGSGEPEMGGGMPPKRKQLSRDEHISQEMAPDCGSMSPSGGTAKRRRQRRTSQDQSIVPPIVPPDSHPDTSSNSCDILPPAVSSSPAASLVTKPKIETDRLSAASSTSSIQQPPPQSPMLVKEKIEPPDLIQPKAEYLDDPSDDHIEDLTLDDDDDDDSYMAKPGSSHAPDSQGYDSSWQYSADTSNPPDMFLGSQDPAGNQNNSQEDTSMNLYLSSDETGDRSDLDAQMENNPDVDERRYHYCAHCDFKSIYKASLSNHIRTIHQKQELIKCRLCSFETVDRRELLVHMKIHADVDKRLYQCAHCDIRYKSKVSLRAHIRIKHTKKGLIKCNLCDYRALYRSSLEVHMAKHKSEDEKSYKCPHCEYRSGLKSSIKRHIRIKHTGHGLIECSYEAADKSDLNVHTKNHKDADEIYYQCAHCNFRSKYKASLRNHIRIRHTKQGLIKCTMCCYEAHNKSKLEAHMVKHRNTNESPFQCAQCDFKSKYKGNLRDHLRRAHTKQGLKCSSCEYRAKYRSRLEIHMTKHMSRDKKPFKCPHCEYRSALNSNLRSHIRIKHSRQGLIDCSLCEYKGVSKSALETHMLKHMSIDERPYKCSHCEYRAVHTFSLARHIRSKHAREGMIECSLCDYQTVNKTALAGHMKRRHWMVTESSK